MEGRGFSSIFAKLQAAYCWILASPFVMMGNANLLHHLHHPTYEKTLRNALPAMVPGLGTVNS